MPYIMQQTCEAHLLYLFLGKAQMLCDCARHMHSSQAMLKPGMIGSGIDRLYKPELLDPFEPLHRTGPDEQPLQHIRPNCPVNRVLDDL